jgi:hypothetical protein
MKHCIIDPFIMSPPMGLDFSLFSFFYHNAASNEAEKKYQRYDPPAGGW